MILTAHGESDIGCVRKKNEDYVDWLISKREDKVIAILADGMGAYHGGALASRIAVEAFKKECAHLVSNEASPQENIIDQDLNHGAKQANHAVQLERNKSSEYEKMGTTLVACLCQGNKLTVIHAGDSRCYLFRDETLIQLTRDDSIIQDMLDRGDIETTDIAKSPMKNVLTKALGVESELSFSISHQNITQKDIVLCCSDGLYNTLSEARITEVLQKAGSADQITKSLIAQSIKNEAKDNTSVIVIKTE